MKSFKLNYFYTAGALFGILAIFSVATAQTGTYTNPFIIPPMFSQNIGTGALTEIVASDITQTTATIVGKTAKNTPPFIVYFDLKQAGTFDDKFTPQVKSDGTFSYKITGLTPAYSYHFVAIRTSDNRTRLSAMNSFVTPEVSAKLYVSKLDDKSATIQATITEGAKNPAIIYGEKFGNLGNPVSMKLVNGVYSADISGLKENTNYFYQLQGDSYDSTSKKLAYSPALSFSTYPKKETPPPAPVFDSTGSGTVNPISYDGKALVQCGQGNPLLPSGKQACGFQQFLELISRIIVFLLFLVAPIIAVVVILYGGLLILTAGGNTENIGKAKGMMWKVVVGLVIAMGAWLLIKAILVALNVDTNVFPVFY